MEKIKLYVDAECKLCATSVIFLNKGIKSPYFIEVNGIQTATIDLPKRVKSLESVGMFYNNQWFVEWRVVRLAFKLRQGFQFKILYLLVSIIPSFIGNVFYRFISKRRLNLSKRFFNNACIMPSNFYPSNKKSRIEINDTAFSI